MPHKIADFSLYQISWIKYSAAFAWNINFKSIYLDQLAFLTDNYFLNYAPGTP